MRSLTAPSLLFGTAALSLVIAACSSPPVLDPPSVATVAAPVASAKPSDAPATEVAPPPVAATPCGELSCMQYASAKAAFAKVLESKPVIVAVGEAHAQKGTEHIDTATARFTAELLPMLKADKSDLVLELMIPDPKCKKATKEVEKNVEKPVTNTQRKSNKNEFQKMAAAANAMGMRSHILRPTCAHLKEVADAGDSGVLKMLSLIAYLSDDMAKRILARNKKTSVDKGMVLYGGAMHNDLSPREGREKFSFGPALSKHVAGRYVEIDLIVPEYIKDNETWQSLPWFEHYDRAKLGNKVTLFTTGPHSYTLIFKSTPAT